MFVAVASRRGGRVVAAVQRAAASRTLVWRGAESHRASVRRESRGGIGSRPGNPAFSATGTNEADRPTIASGKADAGPGGAFRRRATGAAGLLLLVAVAAGLLGQGAYYGSMQRYVGLLVAAAAVLALAGWPPTRSDAGLLPVAPALALAAWMVLDAALLGVPGAGGGPALLLGVVAVLLVCRRLGQEDREVLLLGVTGLGLLVALAGWLGVAGHIGAWVWQDPDIWRASSTLSYPNATAAVLAPIALLVLARLTDARQSVPLALAATGLLAGLAATASRAGALALVVGLVLLAGLRGPRATTRVMVGPCAGALLALACLVPSMPVASQPRPALALVGLAAGLALTGTVARLGWWSAVALVLGGVLMGGLALIAVAGGGTDNAARTVAQARVTLASPDRGGALRAAVGVAAERPLTGAGPGHADLQQRGQDGGTRFFEYAHNEYAQLAAELGLVGLVLLAVLLLALARLLWRARATGPAGATWAGVVAATAAFTVHSGFDFVWHLPAVLLTVLLLVGVVLPAPGGADARKGSVTAQQGRKPDENQSTN